MRKKYRTIHINNVEIVLLILLCACTSYFIISITAQLNFKKDIIKKYNNTYPVQNGVYLNFREIIDNNKLKFKKNEDLKIERNLYEFLAEQSDIIDKIYFNKTSIYKSDKVNIRLLDIDKKNLDNTITIYYINKDYYFDYIKKNVLGNGFEVEDFNLSKDITPIIMGKNYDMYYKMNDIIENPKIGKKFKVVGFLEKGVSINNQGGTPSYSIQNLDNFIVAPYNQNGLKEAIYNELSMKNSEDINNINTIKIYDLSNIISTLIFTVKPNLDVSSSISELNDRLITNGVSTELVSLNNDIFSFFDKFDNQLKFNIFLLMILTISSIVIIGTIIDYTVMEYEYNIGILYSFGANKRDILKIFYAKILPFSAVSYIIGTIVYIIANKSIYLYFVNDIKIVYIVYGAILYFSIIICSLIMPINKIKSRRPIDLLREEN